jgi:hypothetical protein
VVRAAALTPGPVAIAIRLYLARGWRTDLPRLVLLLQAGNAVSFFGYGLILPFEIIYLHQIRGFATATASARVPGARCGARNIGVRNSTLTERSDLVCRGLLLRGPPVVSVAMAWAVRGALELAAAFGSRCRGPGRYHWPARPRNRGKRKGLSPGPGGPYCRASVRYYET